ncbi:MAG: AarF/ABC1/UbiB kinase family protein [Chloroflexota bacterium]|nr:AarF/ABC1/UbiB kinase family protein [Chloroflexota bacterium]
MSRAASKYKASRWNFSYMYRVRLVSLRMVELMFISLRFLLFRGPLITMWIRLPGIRNINPPYGELARMLAPSTEHSLLLVGGLNKGTKSLGDVKSKEELLEVIAASKKEAESTRRAQGSISGGLIRGLMVELGPTFIKWGQVASMRPELPAHMREELRVLQDKLPAMKFKRVLEIIETELEQPWDEVFEYIDPVPLAAASLSQVHKAKLKTGEEVALKVQRHNLRGIVSLDSVILVDVVMATMRKLMPLLKRRGSAVFTSFRDSLQEEIDFYLEARMQEWFYDTVQEHPIYSQSIKIARVHWDYTTSRLLTMELVKNYHRFDSLLEMDTDKLWDMLNWRIPQYPKEYPIQLLWSTVSFWGDMWINWGLIHGDPHWGNVYVVEPSDGESWKVFVCDFGMMEDMPPEGKDWVTDILGCMLLHRDPERMIEVLTRFVPEGPEGEELAMQARPHVKRMLRRHAPRKSQAGVDTQGQSHWAGSSFAGEIADEFFQFPSLHLPDWFWLWAKSQGYLEGLALTFWSDHNVTDMMIPQLKTEIKRKIMASLDDKSIVEMRGQLGELSDWFTHR